MEIVIAASSQLSAAKVKITDYTRMNWRTKAALDHDMTDLIIVGDSKLSILQSIGVITCKRDSLLVKVAYYKTFFE